MTQLRFLKITATLAFAAMSLATPAPGPLAAQDASKVQPSAYRVIEDNASVRVLDFTSRPGMGVCGSGMHSHPAHLTVLLSPATVRVSEHGKTFTVQQKVGDSFWSGPVTHEVENVGGAAVHLLIIEVKSPGHARG